MLLTIAAGLFSSVLYALHDLVAQNVTRRVGVLRTLLWIIPVGTVIILPLALLLEGLPASPAAWRAAALCMLGGVLYLGSWFTMLRALAVGDLALVCPLSSLEGLFVALFAIASGQSLTVLLALGVALAVLGGTLASLQGRARSTRGAGWALLTGLLWAAAVVLFDRAGELSWLAQAAWSRLVTGALFVSIAVVVLRRAARRSEPQGPAARTALSGKLAAILVAAGLFELGGLVCMTYAIQRGPLVVAGVTVAQYATVAVLLGLVFLKERPRRHQIAGVLCTLVAVTLLSAAG